jgi:hypothetical protein
MTITFTAKIATVKPDGNKSLLVKKIEKAIACAIENHELFNN